MDELGRILTADAPFGPRATEDLIHFGTAGADLLFDRSNLIYAQTESDSLPTYIIGRKGAGKTAFLVGSRIHGKLPRVMLTTSHVYAEMLRVLHVYNRERGALFVDQRADIWMALFEHVAVFHAAHTADETDPQGPIQVLSDYVGDAVGDPDGATIVAERFLQQLQRRVVEEPGAGFRDVITGLSHGRVRFAEARRAAAEVLERRARPPIIVMDNLEDLHVRLPELKEVMAGLFRAVGHVVSRNVDHRPYGLQICLPSELFDQFHEISASPEKDLQGRYVKIYWTARELLRLTGTRLQLFLRTHHPSKLEMLERKASLYDEPIPEIALLRAALPDRIHSGLDIEEDPLAYLLRHTQLLPRHLIQILNSVFSRRDRGSVPWEVTPAAVLSGVRHAEHELAVSILNAYQLSYPLATPALRRLTGRLDISFPASRLHKIYNQQGLKKLTDLDFDDFLAMLFTLGVVGVRFDQTGRYNKAHFQYTFDYELVAQEDVDHLCLHPLFTRYLLERTLPRLRELRVHATYPYGCDPKGDDYRQSFGYLGA
ncbi:hypothetical protein Lesp02_08810 [Lentzea sp. NBRC 105346]|uniref:P-loop ATPase, Sll1717 family n=1 Tax=Lentzea sp. NBRC 105346 TaxID=3032205 RepID=UPI0024A44061|nr:hypothetical protein [Lentzea sp. NBRC 105346]GLZ28691.1 hypothetical protein Lesp02_08810 [Lentzea sp. NBRC 105346]